MNKIILAIACCVALSGCATTNKAINHVGTSMCNNADTIRIGYITMIQNATFIVDPVVRQTIIGGAQAGIEALKACPTTASP